MTSRTIEPWLQKSHDELKAFIRDRGEKFIDAASRMCNKKGFLKYTTEPVYIELIKFATEKFQNKRICEFLTERRNEVDEKLLDPLENAIRDGLHEWEMCQDESKWMESQSGSVGLSKIFFKLSVTEKNTQSSAQCQPTEWKPVKWEPIYAFPESSATTTTSVPKVSIERRPATRRSQIRDRSHMNRLSESESNSEINVRIDFEDGKTIEFGFGPI